MEFHFGSIRFAIRSPDEFCTGHGWNCRCLGLALVVGHEFTKKPEMDAELYTQRNFPPLFAPPLLDVGGRYKIHRPFILLLMAGRSLAPAQNNQPDFVGYFWSADVAASEIL
jgi:hypothetical protein